MGFCLVIMNLLVGLAVSDIQELMKSVESFRNTKLFNLLPATLKVKMRRLLDHSHCEPVQVKYSDISDKKYPETLKRILFDFCLRKEEDKKKKEQEEQLKEVREEMLKMKEIHEISISMKEMLAKLTNNTQ